jgi:hypothetical protein
MIMNAPVNRTWQITEETVRPNSGDQARVSADLLDALETLYGCVKGWGVPFLDDAEEWPADKAKIEAAIANAYSAAVA